MHSAQIYKVPAMCQAPCQVLASDGELTEEAQPAGEYRLAMSSQRANVGPRERGGAQCPVTQWRQNGPPGQDQWEATGNPES